MAYQGDTDRIAGELLNLLKNSLSKPGTATAASQPQPQVDDNNILNMIKDVLAHNLPAGMRPSPDSTGTSPVEAMAGAQTTLSGSANAYVDWLGMYRRQEDEREAMNERQLREREETQRRHLLEMESFAGIRRVQLRPTPTPVAARPARIERASRKFGIVPGKSVGKWAVETENGTKAFIAVSDEQAMREARRYGLTPASARLLEVHNYTQGELHSMLSTFGVPGKRESMEAEFEQAIRLGLIPENATFERLPDREWGYRVGAGKVLRKGADLVTRRGL